MLTKPHPLDIFATFNDKLDKLPKSLQFLDSDYLTLNNIIKTEVKDAHKLTMEASRVIPFLILHLACLLVFVCGISTTAVLVAVGLYWLRIFFVGAFFHRYFSHRAYKTSRFAQCIFGFLTLTCVQRGPLWWASHHRNHHKYSDTEYDIHSPVQKGFFWSHVGWITTSENMVTDYRLIKDYAKYPELVFFNRLDWLGSAFLIFNLLVAGAICQTYFPELHTNSFQLLVWGYFVSSVCLFHSTSMVNSIVHIFGYRTFPTTDNSRNNFIVAFFTCGEGWHNNHHFYPWRMKQGYQWYEYDVTAFILRIFEKLGIIWDIREIKKTDHENNQKTKSKDLVKN